MPSSKDKFLVALYLRMSAIYRRVTPTVIRSFVGRLFGSKMNFGQKTILNRSRKEITKIDKERDALDGELLFLEKSRETDRLDTARNINSSGSGTTFICDFNHGGRYFFYDVPYDAVTAFTPQCRICGHEMIEVYRMIDDNGRIGCGMGVCKFCATVRHMYLPPESWYDDYYKENWNKNVENTEEDPGYYENPMVYNLTNEYLETPSKVLDVGCSRGATLLPFKKAGHSVFGIEASEARAHWANQYGVPTIRSFFKDGRKHPRLEEMLPFHLVSMKQVLEHIRDPLDVLRFIHELLEDGGYLFINIPNFWGEISPGNAIFFPHVNSWSHWTIDLLLKRAGFEIVWYKEDLKSIWLLGKKTTKLDKKSIQKVIEKNATETTTEVVKELIRSCGIHMASPDSGGTWAMISGKNLKKKTTTFTVPEKSVKPMKKIVSWYHNGNLENIPDALPIVMQYESLPLMVK